MQSLQRREFRESFEREFENRVFQRESKDAYEKRLRG